MCYMQKYCIEVDSYVIIDIRISRSFDFGWKYDFDEDISTKVHISFPTDSRYSNAYKLQPFFYRHLSILIRMRMYTVYSQRKRNTQYSGSVSRKGMLTMYYCT